MWNFFFNLSHILLELHGKRKVGVSYFLKINTISRRRMTSMLSKFNLAPSPLSYEDEATTMASANDEAERGNDQGGAYFCGTVHMSGTGVDRGTQIRNQHTSVMGRDRETSRFLISTEKSVA